MADQSTNRLNPSPFLRDVYSYGWSQPSEHLTPGTPQDIDFPDIGPFVPASASTILRTDSIQIDVTDFDAAGVGGVALVLIGVRYATLGRTDLVYDGSLQVSPYTVSVTPITDGFRYTIARTGGWAAAPIIEVHVSDKGGNASSATATYSLSPAAASPSVTFSPVSGGSILRSDTLQVDVTDPGNTVAEVQISAAYAALGRTDAVYDGTAQVSPYVISVSTITNGFRYQITRTGGWASNVVLKVHARDVDDNITNATASYSLSPAAASPSVAYTPISGSSVLRTDTIVVDVTDPGGGFAEAEIGIQYPVLGFANARTDVAYDGSAQAAPYTVSVSAISNGFRYQITRTGGDGTGFLGNFTVKVRTRDVDGNVTTSTASYTLNPAPAAPVVGPFVPVSGSSITRTTLVQFDVTDTQNGQNLTEIWINYPNINRSEIAWTLDQIAPFPYFVQVDPITNGNRYTIIRFDGWIDDPTININVYDNDGNGVGHQGVYTLSPAPASPVAVFTPVSGATIGRNASVQVDLTDADGDLSSDVLISVEYLALQREDVAAKGGAQVSPYFVSVTPITNGNRYTISRTGGWLHNPTIHVRARDTNGFDHVASLSASYNSSPTPGAPVLSNIQPATPAINSTDTISLDVTDDSGTLSEVRISANYPALGFEESVYQAGAPVAPYSVFEVAIPNGIRYQVTRAGGFPTDFFLKVFASDDLAEDMEDQTFLFEPIDVPPPETGAPVVSNFNPAPGTQIDRSASVAFDVTDETGQFARIMVVAWFKETGIQEVVHDGDAFVGYYSATSTRVVITNGFRFTCARFGGWLYAPTFRVFPIDAAGNQP